MSNISNFKNLIKLKIINYFKNLRIKKSKEYKNLLGLTWYNSSRGGYTAKTFNKNNVVLERSYGDFRYILKHIDQRDRVVRIDRGALPYLLAQDLYYIETEW